MSWTRWRQSSRKSRNGAPCPRHCRRSFESFSNSACRKIRTVGFVYAGDVRLALEGVFEVSAKAPAPRRSAAIWVTAALALAATAAAVALWWTRAPHTLLVMRFVHALPAGESFSALGHPVLNISRDGATVVYVAQNRLYRRHLDAFQAEPIRGTDGVPTTPFFSPDGRNVG